MHCVDMLEVLEIDMQCIYRVDDDIHGCIDNVRVIRVSL